jgi:L-alanine-DL-glutamate epimerase-like enolase superfamily enzyme
MKVVKLETFPINIPYLRKEVSALIAREGVSDVIVKLTADNGLVGWGEACMNSETIGIEKAVQAAAPFVLGRDPWESDAIARDYYVNGGWQFQPMTGNFAFAGIDMALWDLCGKEAGQPLYRLFGGAMRDEVDYFCYLHWGTPEDVAEQCRDGKERGYSTYYFKVGVDAGAEEKLLDVIRSTLGPEARIRVDANQAWTVPQAVRIINRWHERFDLDFVEGPVPIEPIELTLDVKRRVAAAICINEGLWRFSDALNVIGRRAGDYLCFSSYWVGTLRRFQTAMHLAHHEGQLICKHTHGEFGIAAACGQHMMIAAPNSAGGHQQTAQMMADDVLVERIPIRDGPKWGRIEGPGLGVEVSEEKVRAFHEHFLRHGGFPPYGDRFSRNA